MSQEANGLVVEMLQWVEANGTANPSVLLLVREAIRLLDPSAALSDYRADVHWQPPPPVHSLLARASKTLLPEGTP